MTEGFQAGYVLPPLIVIIVGLALTGVVFAWAPATRSRSLFLGVLAGLVIWGCAVLGMRLSDDPVTALAWNRWTPVAVYVMFLFFYLFVREYTRTRGESRLVLAFYVVLALSIVAAPLGFLVKDLRVEPYGYAPVTGILAVPLAVTGFVAFCAAIRTLVRRYRVTTSEEERNRLLYLMVAACLSVVGALLDITSNLPPLGIWANVLFCGISAVALLKYRLLDVPRVARRTLTYLVLGVMVAVPYVLTLLVIQRLFGARLESFWSYLVTVLFLALFLHPLYEAAQRLVDRLFYRQRYDALRALEQFGREAHHEVDLDVLSCRLTRLVTDALHATRTCLFLPMEDTGTLQLVSCDGMEPLQPLGSFSRGGALIRWMAHHPEILAHRMLEVEPQLQSLSQKELQLLGSMEADLLVPVTSASGQLSGLLVLGGKRSRHRYSGEDRRLLEALGRQMAISLDNARLYNDAVRARHDLERWLDGMDDSVLITGQDRAIRFLNRSARTHLGATVGAPCWAAIGRDRPCDFCSLTQAWTGDQGSIRLSRRIGQRDYEIVAASLVDPNGERSLISVLRDVTERKRFEEELRHSQEQLRELAVHQESVREDERTGIARELHDELGQLLTAMKMDISWISRHLDSMKPGQMLEKLDGMKSVAETSIAAVQRMSSQLRPGILDDLGLVAALEWLVREFQQRSGIQCDAAVDETLEIGGTHATVLFRICQESLTNVARHAEASKVNVVLNQRGRSVVLTVSDNGKGITTDEIEHPRSFGVIGMRERARALGGTVTISSSPGMGTTVVAVLPLSETPPHTLGQTMVEPDKGDRRPPVADTSAEFYRRNAGRYSEVAHGFLQSVYVQSSHPLLTDDSVLISRALALSPGRRCLDAGCGAGARDVYALHRVGCDVQGIDAIAENIVLAQQLHPEIADRVSVADLRDRLPFEDGSFDLVLCNAVLQHISRTEVMGITLPELVRVLRPSGILQLMFKHGAGVLTLFDADYGEERSFLLHDEHEILETLDSLGMDLIEVQDDTELGGVMYFTDPKGAGHCVFYMRKRA